MVHSFAHLLSTSSSSSPDVGLDVHPSVFHLSVHSDIDWNRLSLAVVVMYQYCMFCDIRACCKPEKEKEEER